MPSHQHTEHNDTEYDLAFEDELDREFARKDGCMVLAWMISGICIFGAVICHHFVTK